MRRRKQHGFANPEAVDRVIKGVRDVERLRTSQQELPYVPYSSGPVPCAVKVIGAVVDDWYPAVYVYRDIHSSSPSTNWREYDDDPECYVQALNEEALEINSVYEGSTVGVFQFFTDETETTLDPAAAEYNGHPAVIVTPIVAATSSTTTHWLEPVECVVQAAYVPSGVGTWDGVALGTGDRVLIWDVVVTHDTRAPVPTNGIYNVNHAGVWTRATDANTIAKLEGAVVYVKNGTLFGGVTAVCYYVEGTTINVHDVGFKAQVFRGYGDGYSIARYGEQYGHFGSSPDPFLRQAHATLTPTGAVGGGMYYLFENLKVPGSIRCGATVGTDPTGSFTWDLLVGGTGQMWGQNLYLGQDDVFHAGGRSIYGGVSHAGISFMNGTVLACSVSAVAPGLGGYIGGLSLYTQSGDTVYATTSDGTAKFGIYRASVGSYTGADGSDSVGNTFVGGICTVVGSGGISVDGGTW